LISSARLVQLPLDESKKWYHATQYHEGPISSVKYIVAQGDSCDICWINGIVGRYLKVIIDPPILGEIYTLINVITLLRLDVLIIILKNNFCSKL